MTVRGAVATAPGPSVGRSQVAEDPHGQTRSQPILVKNRQNRAKNDDFCRSVVKTGFSVLLAYFAIVRFCSL